MGRSETFFSLIFCSYDSGLMNSIVLFFIFDSLVQGSWFWYSACMLRFVDIYCCRRLTVQHMSGFSDTE
jgi:hypothetical protein